MGAAKDLCNGSFMQIAIHATVVSKPIGPKRPKGEGFAPAAPPPPPPCSSSSRFESTRQASQHFSHTDASVGSAIAAKLEALSGSVIGDTFLTSSAVCSLSPTNPKLPSSSFLGKMLRLARPKPLTSSSSSSSSSSLDSMAHRLLQRCSVSGTAKGKAKLKAGQTLKRSRLTTKKSPGPSDSATKGGGKRGPSEAEALVEACLNAPTPLRYLTEKQRAREAEREKMGLISKGPAARDRHAEEREVETGRLREARDNRDPGLGFDLVGTGRCG
ncbi:hypothetical protein NL676_011692 [Syzygium grande]|nr:hypothetical protein NL676_011692 [Syzygium grande]